MLFYIILVISLFVCFTLSDYKWQNNYLKKILLAYPCIILFCISVFRFDIGYDYPNYYNLIGASFDQLEFERIEPLAQCIVKIVRYIGEPWLLFVLFGVPTYFLAFGVCSKTGHFQLAFWTYVFLFLLDSFSTIRQAAAIAIIMWAVIYMQEKKMFPYVVACILASLFHSSALIMLPVYFIYHYGSWRMVLVGMIGFSFLFQIVISVLVDNDLYASYLKNENELEGGTLLRYFYIILYIFLFLLSYKRQLVKENKRFFTALLPAFFFPFLFGGHIGGRISSYFYVMFLFMIPQILSKCSGKLRILSMLVLMTFFFAILYISQKQDKSPFTPYQSIFEVDLEHLKFK